jgi:hypothetical protein
MVVSILQMRVLCYKEAKSLAKGYSASDQNLNQGRLIPEPTFTIQHCLLLGYNMSHVYSIILIQEDPR